jgi:predicted aldo/keto reductase-like oxidoreductase
MNNGSIENMGRRDFLKLLGAGTVTSLAVLNGCTSSRQESVKAVPTGRMTYRTDPKTGDRISLLGYGCMRLPRVPVKDSVENQNDIDQEAVNASVDYALAHGVNFFDTSPMYCKGQSERSMGIALSRHPRNTYFISTKMSNFRDDSREKSLDMYRRSFEYLKVDYLDYYLVHSVGTFDLFKKRYLDNGVLDFMLKEREAGRIRNLGWSFHGEREFFDYMMSSGVTWDFVLIQLNYFDWNTAQGRSNIEARYLYETLAGKNIPALVMEPLLGGRLAKPHYKAQAMLKQADPEASIASWAFRFAGSLPNVLTVLSGMTYMEHLQDNIRAYSPLKPLTEQENRLLDQVSKTMLEYQNINCTGCQYCMPCRYGLDIPGIFTHYNRCLNEGNFPDNVQDPDYRRARRAFLIGLDRNVEKLRQANHCTGCNICAKDCPQYIKIPAEMEKIDRFVEKLKLGAYRDGSHA